MLSGMGGDEIDAGYNRHKILFNLEKYRKYSVLPLLSFLPSRISRDLKRLKSFFQNDQIFLRGLFEFSVRVACSFPYL